MCELYGGFGNYLGTYQTLNFHYDAPSRTCYYNNSPSWQCCNTVDMMNRWQMQQTMNCLQAQTQSLKNFENTEKLINSIKPIKLEEEKGEDMYYETISDYMEKEFLYESELKEIEDKFCFKFEDLNIDNIKNKKLYNISNETVNKLKNENFKKLEYISKIDIIDFSFSPNSVYVYCNGKSYYSYKIESYNMNKKNKDDIKDMCNTILKSELPEYQQFYEKYKNRIVKDNEYEDLSYYEKILEENA